MTETKYTPGPWDQASEDFYPQGFLKGDPVEWVWIAPQGWRKRICRVVLLPDDIEEQKANVNLIKAAPELLETLEGVITAMEGLGQGPFDAEREIIAKARGEI